MKRINRILLGATISLFIIGNLANAQVGGGVSSPNYFRKIGNAINFIASTWELGTVGAPIQKVYVTDIDVAGTCTGCVAGAGTGDVVGAASSTDNALVRFDSTTGKLIQNSVGILGDTGDFSGIGRMAFGNTSSFGEAGGYNKLWDFENEITDFSASTSWNGLRVITVANPAIDLTGGAAKYIYGQLFDTTVKPGNTKNVEFLNGMTIGATHNGTGTVAAQSGLYVTSYATSSGSITDNIGEFIGAGASGTGNIAQNIGAYYRTGHSGAGGSITLDKTIVIDTPDHTQPLTTHIGLHIEDQAFGTNSWAIKSDGGDVNFSAITGDTADLQLSGADITHGLTTLSPTDTFLRFQPISGTAGGAQISGLSDTDAVGMSLKGIMGSTDPTDATPAFKITGAKSNGTTGVSDLGAAETVFSVLNNTTSLISVLGNGNTNFTGAINKITVTPPASGATLTLANGSSLITSGGNSLTLTTTGATNVTLPTSGTLINSGVTSLSSLATVGTITSGTWTGTSIAIANGGTGQTTATAAFDALSPNTTRGDISVRGASSNGRLALGAKGRGLISNGTDAVYGSMRKFNFNAMGGWNAIGTSIGSYGALGNTANTGTTSANTSTNGAYVDYATAATTDADAGVASAASTRILDNKFFGWVAFQMQATTNVRFYCGFTSTATIATSLGADDPATLRMAGLQFSTNRGDTNFQFLTDDNTTQTLTSTAIPVDTNMHILHVDATSGSSIVYTLYSASGVVEATATQSTNLPLATAAYSLTCGNRTLTNSAASVRVFKAYIESDLIQ